MADVQVAGPARGSPLSERPWWKGAVFYQIYPRSYCDTDGDGVGDLEGIRLHLDHLEWLGVDAIWISPFFKSPMKDFGYDVADYCAVDPLFGTLEDFDRLVADAHGRGIKVMIDWVPNHSSDEHEWFVEARSSRDNPKRDWYWWRDGDGVTPPNNWKAAFSRGKAPAWTWEEQTEQWYLHCFLPGQPDLNWHNPEVVAAMHDTLRFWLDRGVDGFRMDVVHLIGKDPALPDLPADGSQVVVSIDDPDTHVMLRDIRKVLDDYDGQRTSVGEVYVMDTARVATYYGDDDELHMSFNFPSLWAPWEADAWKLRINEVVENFHPADAWPTWVLSNHDVPRHRTRYGSEERARAAAVLLLTLRGTPFMYAGEELGLEDAVIPKERRVDPGRRDGCRAPFPWDSSPSHGWVADDNWLPWPPDADRRNVATERDHPDSMLNLYRRILAARRASAALVVGDFELQDSPDGCLAYRRFEGDDERTVAVNFTDEEVALEVSGQWQIEVASNSGEGEQYRGVLTPNQAVILRRS